MASHTLPSCSRSVDQRSAKQYTMRGFKCRTLATVVVSALFGATMYALLYSQLTPPPSQSWRLQSRAEKPFMMNRGVRRGEKLGVDLKNFQAKIDEVDGNGDGVKTTDTWLKMYNSRRDCSGENNCSETNFKIVWPFHFPQPRYSFSMKELLVSKWVTDLQSFLKTVEGRQISVVTSSIEHTDILFNWLISAHLIADPPLVNILVLTLDESLHDLAQSHGFASLYVSPEMVIDPKVKVTRVFSQVHIVRLAVVRLMNHYGFDVVNYDCDAVLLKNPQTIFDAHKDVDMIGTFGKGPGYLFTKWGVTLNTGVMLLRSNAKLETYWEAMSMMKHATTDDQGNINKALDFLNIKWLNIKPTDNIDVLEKDVFGVIDIKSPKQMKLIVMLMSFGVVCRQTCDPERRNDYFVWHAVAIKENRTVERKISQAKVGNAWFLSEKWQKISEAHPSLKGVEWLKAVVDPNLTNLMKIKPQSQSNHTLPIASHDHKDPGPELV